MVSTQGCCTEVSYERQTSLWSFPNSSAETRQIPRVSVLKSHPLFRQTGCERAHFSHQSPLAFWAEELWLLLSRSWPLHSAFYTMFLLPSRSYSWPIPFNPHTAPEGPLLGDLWSSEVRVHSLVLSWAGMRLWVQGSRRPQGRTHLPDRLLWRSTTHLWCILGLWGILFFFLALRDFMFDAFGSRYFCLILVFLWIVLLCPMTGLVDSWALHLNRNIIMLDFLGGASN